MSKWTWAAASCRGTSHLRNSTRIQDAFQCCLNKTNNDIFIAIVADGAGSSLMGGQGASVLSRCIRNNAQTYFQQAREMPTDDVLKTWIDFAREQLLIAATNRQLLVKDFATTLVCAISSAAETIIIHIGDGCAVVKNAETCSWETASWPSHGEYASTTFFVTDDPYPRVNISRFSKTISAVALFSDGLERLALDFAVKQPHQAFFNSVSRAVFASSAAGRDDQLSRHLSRFLDSNEVNSRTDDDKTIVIAVTR